MTMPALLPAHAVCKGDLIAITPLVPIGYAPLIFREVEDVRYYGSSVSFDVVSDNEFNNVIVERDDFMLVIPKSNTEPIST